MNTKTKTANIDAMRQRNSAGENIRRLVDITIAEPDVKVKRDRNQPLPLIGSVEHFYNSHALDKKTTEQLKEILPDLDYAKLMLVSSIISPLDMLSTDVTFGIKDSSLPLPLVEAANNTLMEHFKSHYKIADIVHEAIGEALFDYGAYPLLIVPDTALDDIILNSQKKISRSTEAMYLNTSDLQRQLQPLGLVKPRLPTQQSAESIERFTMAFESYYGGGISSVKEMGEGEVKGLASVMDGITITDNINELKFKPLQYENGIDNINASFEAQIAKLSNESYGIGEYPRTVQRTDKVKKSPLDEKLSKPVAFDERDVVSLKPADQYGKKLKGEPMVLKVPPSAIINVLVPGTTNKFIGHYIIIDAATGYFVDPWNHDVDELLLSDRGPSQMNGEQGTIINAHRNIFGYDNRGRDRAQLRQAINLTYTEVLEDELKNAVANGAFDNNVEINLKDRIGQLMLARALKGQKTKFLFVPTSQMTYMHYELDGEGVGRSLMAKTKLQGSIRAVLMLASIMANVRKAVDVRDVTITIEDEDPDPKATLDDVVDLMIRSKSNDAPIGDTSWTSIMENFSRAGINIQTKGGNWPQIDIEKGQSQLNINAEVSKELLDDQKRQHYQGLYLPAEAADATGEVKFAQIAIQDNLLFAKRIMYLQDISVFHISDHTHKYVKSNGPLMEKLDASIREALKGLKKPAKKELASMLTSRGYDGVDENDEFGDSEALVGIVRNMLVTAFQLQLPSPQISKHEMLQKDMELYEASVDRWLDFYIGKDHLLLTDASREKIKQEFDFGDEETPTVERVRSLLKQRIMRQWMMDNSVGLEMINIFNPQEDDKEAAISSIIQHSDALKKLLTELKIIPEPEEEEDYSSGEVEEGMGEDTFEEEEVEEEGEGEGEDEDTTPEEKEKDIPEEPELEG